MSAVNDKNALTCAACGKDGDDLKTCNACKLVMYCDASCQRGHWSNHKKECKKRAAELHDENLFKKPPPQDECPICFQQLPISVTGQQWKACCGKMLCMGCINAAFLADNRRLCPFCRTPYHTSDGELMERIKKRADCDDAIAIHSLGCHYSKGEMGLPQDHNKAIELWLQAGELGCVEAYYNVGHRYYTGRGVESDVKKAVHFWELGAMGGVVKARHILGILERDAGNMQRAMKHFMMSAAAGYDNSVNEIRVCFMNGDATKDDFEKALRAHKEAADEMKSDQREAAAAYLRSRGLIE